MIVFPLLVVLVVSPASSPAQPGGLASGDIASVKTLAGKHSIA